MREIIIKNRKETDVTDETLYDLFNESFKRWKEKGLEAPWLNVSFEKFCKQLNTSTVFVAVDANTDELLGLQCFRKNKKHRWAYDFYLAVKPKAQGQGIASRMLAYEAEVIKQAGYLYLKDNTATTAEWSVRWHLKNGYRIVGYYRVPNYNFTNYVFRKQLAPSILWGPTLGPLTARMSFAASWLVNHLLKHSDGWDNLLGRFARKIIHKEH
jgi:ribosomal protein S18 acetylase RimI-like enzyme